MLIISPPSKDDLWLVILTARRSDSFTCKCYYGLARVVVVVSVRKFLSVMAIKSRGCRGADTQLCTHMCWVNGCGWPSMFVLCHHLSTSHP